MGVSVEIPYALVGRGMTMLAPAVIPREQSERRESPVISPNYKKPTICERASAWRPLVRTPGILRYRGELQS